MIIYQGNLQHGYGVFVLIVPEGFLDGQVFTAYWTIDGVPNFYQGSFQDTPHRSKDHEFSFKFPRGRGGEKARLDSIDVEFSRCDDHRGIVASLSPAIENVVNSGDDRIHSVYTGLLSGHPESHGKLLVLSVCRESAVGETVQLLLFSPGVPVEREDHVLERFKSNEAGMAFTASSSRWILEASQGDEDRFKVSLTSIESGARSSATLQRVSEDISIPGAITVTLINDSGQTLQYWTARSDPHLAEDLINLGLDVWSFVGPDWSFSKALKTFADGVEVYQKIKEKLSVPMSSIDLLQRKTGKVGSVDLLEPNQTITFWDFDGTITGGMNISLTWFRLNYDEEKKTALLHFDSATRTFDKLDTYVEIRASTLLDVPDAFRDGEKLKRQGSRLRSPLPIGWTAKTKTISLSAPLVRCNFHGQKIGNLTLTAGKVPDPAPGSSPVWSNGVLYNPSTSEVYKTTFNIYRSDVRTDDPVGYLDDTHLLYVEGDLNEYRTDDCTSYATRGTFIRHYFYQPPACNDLNKLRATAWSHKVVFLEYAIIQKDPTGTYTDLEAVEFPREVGNPKKKPGSSTCDDYEPFLDAVSEGLCVGDNWTKKYWAFWFDPDTDRVYGAVYRARNANERAGVSPWIIRRKYPPTYRSPSSLWIPRAEDWPVVAFVCQGDMPINFNRGIVDDDVTATKYDS